MEKSVKAEDLENNKLLFAVGFCKLLAARIADKPRRVRVLDIVNDYPGTDAVGIGRRYLEKHGEKIASSTLDGDLKMLVFYGLCGYSRTGRKKFYRTSDFMRGLCDLAMILDERRKSALLHEIALVMKG